jgi:prolyl-tRNA editing enzyme YbaK/EbsC (Cys-tRNA(Pro) deacylase)
MHPTTAAFVERAAALGVTVDPKVFPEGTRTAEDAAAAVGVDVGQIVKSLVFRVIHEDGEEELVMALVSGADRLDEEALAREAGAVRTGRADADAVRAVTGYAIGGVPPFAHAHPLTVFVDRALLAQDEVWAAAGTPDSVFPTEPETLVRISGGRIVDVRR